MQKGFAVVGAGTWGQNHARVYREHEGARLVWVCDANEATARKVAKEHGAEKFTSDYKDVVADPSVHAVSVATPDFAHAEIVVAAAKAGKHIMCEKPLATTEAECLAMIEAANKAGVMLMTAFHNRFSPPVCQAKQAVDNGELGEVLYIYYRLSDTIFVPTKMLSWAGKSSVLWFIGSHLIDTCCWIIGKPVRRVHGLSRSRVLKGMGIDTPDFYCSTLEFEGGAVAVLENCWVLPETLPTMVDVKAEIVGSKGSVFMDTSSHRTIQKYTQQKGSYPDVLVNYQIHGRAMGFGPECIRHFVDCVVKDQPPLVTGEDGLRAARIVLAIEEAIRRGTSVEVPA